MKILTILLTTLAVTALAAPHFWRGKTLGAEEVAKRWGTAALDVEKFNKGNEKTRAAMAHSLLTNQNRFKHKFVLDIRKELGTPDGFYFSDVFPAYLIQRAQSRSEEAWQIVFLLDKDRKVTEVIIHKNCCD